MLRPVGGGWPRLLLPTLITLLFAVVVRFDALPWLRGPAPYPPEWQWGFSPEPPAGPWLLAALVAATLVGLVAACASSWARRRPRLAAAVLLAAGVLAGFGFQIALAATRPEGALRHLLGRAASRTVTSYHAVAISEDGRDPGAFLARHTERLALFRTTAKHAATHPPGPVLFYRAALWACEGSRGLTEILLRRAGLPDRDFAPPNTRAARAAALLGALLLGLLGAATAWPVAALARTLGLAPLAAARVGILYGLLPGPTLMVGQFDAALALPVAAATALMAAAIATGRSVAAKAAFAGILAALALFTSYGAAVFLAAGGLASLSLAPSRREAARRGVPTLALAAGTAALLTWSTALLGHDPIASARAALAIHREAYTAPRSYALWLLFNPIDLAVFLGPPLAVLSVYRLRDVLAERRASVSMGGRFALAVAGTLAVLTLSGVTRGEVGRIWIPLMPLLLVAILASEEAVGDGTDHAHRRNYALAIGTLLAALCLAIRVSWEI